MECPRCGANINDGDNFCEECGTALKQAPPKNVSSAAFPESRVIAHDCDLAAVTNVGRRHPKNEDSGNVYRFENGDSVLIVSDGVSSSLSATSASQMAIDVIMDTLSKGEGNTRELMISAISKANEKIKELPYETREDGVYGPEATVVVALVKGSIATIGWVGDSRAYLIKDDGQRPLTVDDSWIEVVVAQGEMTREEAAADKRAHYVTQVLGMHDQELEIHITEREFEPGDIVFLCSDGLWNYFQSDNAIINTIKSFGMNSDAAHICEYLVNLANSAGGHDNITAAMLRLK